MARTPEQIADAAKTRLERLRDTSTRRIRSLVLKLKTEDGELIRSELANARAVRSQIVARLREIEKDIRGEIVAGVRLVRREVLASTGGAEDGFAAEAGPALDAIIDGHLDEVTEAIKGSIDEVRAAVDAGVATSAPLERLIDKVEERVLAGFARTANAIDSAIIASGRTVLVTQTELAAEESGVVMLYRYVGPNDRKTRPFCAKHLGKVFSREALDKLDNGQIGPVSSYLGGYGCRHSLAPIELAEAKARGLKIVR